MSVTNFKLIDTRPLVDCAMGRRPAELVIHNCRWVCVQTGEIIPETDIAISGARIAYIGEDASHCIGDETKIVEAANRYASPGFLDGHMHVESGMLTVTEFVRAVAPLGTTSMFIDPHEITNVFGLKGIRLMADEATQQPIHVFVQIPSCIPSAAGFETPGATIGPDEVAEAMQWQGVIGLGEMMNFPGVIHNDSTMHAEMMITRENGKIIGGHYASKDLGLPFHGYVAGGAMDDHEGTSIQDAIVRSRQGIRVMMRYGSAWHDVASQVKAITENGLDSRYFSLCTDDSHCFTLISEGHMDRVVRHAIAQGLQPMTAIQMATINTAEHFGLSREIGMLAPGRYADILLARDLINFHPDIVIAKGQTIAENGVLTIDLPKVQRPGWVSQSVHIPRNLTAEDFKIKTSSSDPLTANVIGIIENQAPTRHLRMRVQPVNGEIKADPYQDIAKLALVERHRNTGKIQVGFVHGFGFTEACGIATTVAHDSHNMIVAGTDETNMAIAVNELIKCGGGQIVVKDGAVIGKVALPIGGLMSDDLAEIVSQKAATVLEGFKACGCSLNNPNMQLSLLALVVIPELRLSDLGLVDVNQFKFIPVFE